MTWDRERYLDEMQGVHDDLDAAAYDAVCLGCGAAYDHPHPAVCGLCGSAEFEPSDEPPPEPHGPPGPPRGPLPDLG